MNSQLPIENCPRTWHIMKHYDMKRFKEWMEIQNIQRLDSGLAVVETFYPSEFLKGDTASDKDSQTPQDFQNILFLKGSDEDIRVLVDDEWNKAFRAQLHYYTDTMTGRPATISEAAMNEFFTNCIKYRGRFEFCPPIDDIELKDRVEIRKGPFTNHEASVVSVRHCKGELQLELAIELISGVISVKMQNVKAHDIVVLNKDATNAIRNDFIEYTQNNLLKIYKHRVMVVNDAETRRRDLDMLNRLCRYRAYNVEGRSAKTHFTALMLICAHLRKNTEEERELREEVLQLLDEINKKSESKAATDIRTYLWIALYISTNNPVYRDACKQYLRIHQPKSKKLQAFIRLMRKGKKC